MQVIIAHPKVAQPKPGAFLDFEHSAVPKPGCLVGICRTSHQPDECGTRPFQIGPGAGLMPRHAQRPPKCLWPRQHSPKKRCLRSQVINLAPPRSVRAWGDGPLRLKDTLRTLGQATSLAFWLPVCLYSVTCVFKSRQSLTLRWSR